MVYEKSPDPRSSGPQWLVDYMSAGKSSKIDEVFKLLVKLEDPNDYIPLLNLAINLDLRNWSQSQANFPYKDLFSCAIESARLDKFLIILRSIQKESLTYGDHLSSVRDNTNRLEHLPIIDYVHKYAIQKDSRFRRNIELRGANNTHWVITKFSNTPCILIDTLFNMKICSLTWISNDRFTKDELFKIQFDRIIEVIVDKYCNTRNITQLKNAINLDIARIIHICIFEMYDSQSRSYLEIATLIADKCRNIRNLDKDDGNDLRMSSFECSRQLRSTFEMIVLDVFKFYSEIHSKKISVNVPSVYFKDDFLPLYIAIKQNAYETTNKLLLSGFFNPHTTDYQGSNLLHWAMEFPKMFELVTRNVGDIVEYKQNYLLRYPIYYAIKYDNYNAFKYCMKHHDFTVSDDDELTIDEIDVLQKSILTIAVKKQNEKIFSELIRIIKPCDKYLYTLKTIGVTDYFPLLAIAVDRRKTRSTIQILETTPNVTDIINQKSFIGITPLVIAAINVDENMMLKLLAHNADINVKIPKDVFIKKDDEITIDNLVKFTDKSYRFDNPMLYYDLFGFVCHWYRTKNVHWYGFPDSILTVLKIIIEQMAIKQKHFEEKSIKCLDSRMILVNYQKQCKSELEKMNELNISQLFTIKEFLEWPINEISNVIQPEQKRDILTELIQKSNSLNAYRKLIEVKLNFL